MIIEEIAKKVESKEADCYVTFDGAENFYLTGFRSTSGISVIFSKKPPIFFTDRRYLELARKKVKELEIKEYESFEKFISFLKEEKVESIVVDPERTKLSVFKKLSESFDVKSDEGFLDEFRMKKSEKEISLITRAIQIAELALKNALRHLKPGITELELRRIIVSEIFKLGGEGEAFPTIVASGPASAIPHWKTSKKVIENNTMVIIDVGVIYQGYVSDITRTFPVGNPPYELKKIYEIVRSAQELGIGLLKAGAECREIDLKVREYISSAGYGEFIMHSLGHGIGIEVHERPYLSFKSKDVLCRNAVVTVEPGIYIPEIGGVRIEDDCIILEDEAWKISEFL